MKKVIIIAIFLFGYQILAGQDLIDNWMIEGETVVTDNINQSTVNAEYCLAPPLIGLNQTDQFFYQYMVVKSLK